MPEKTKRAFLEIEENGRIVNLLNGCCDNITSENSNKKNELKTFPLEPPENLLSRIANFLPQIASDNKELVKKDVKSIDIENVEGTERIIEMNLGLGIFEQINIPSEHGIIINPKESTFCDSEKPKTIVVDSETKNGELSNEILQKSKPRIIFKDEFDDENSESSSIIMNIQSSNRKKPKIIVIDDSQNNNIKKTGSMSK